MFQHNGEAQGRATAHSHKEPGEVVQASGVLERCLLSLEMSTCSLLTTGFLTNPKFQGKLAPVSFCGVVGMVLEHTAPTHLIEFIGPSSRSTEA